MALKPDRDILMDDITMVLDDVAEAGVVLSYHTAGSGAPFGSGAGKVKLATNSSGVKPAGLLLHDFVDIDETQFRRNWHKLEQVIGEKARIVRKGWVRTNKYAGSPTAGAPAYLTSSGVVSTTNGGSVHTPQVGEFMSIPDEDGYAKLFIELPQN